MGVPAFFRWLSRRCGAIVVNCVEDEQKVVDGIKLPSKLGFFVSNSESDSKREK